MLKTHVEPDGGYGRLCPHFQVMALDSTTRMLAPFLDRLSVEELDAVPYGVIQLDAEGRVRAINRVEADDLGWPHERPVGRNFFTEVAPSAFVAEVFGRYVEAYSSQQLDESFRFTFGDSMLPRTVMMRMYFSPRSKSVWIFTANPDGSPLVRGSGGPPCDVRDVPDARVV